MKKSNFLSGAAVSLALLMTACSSDLPTNGNALSENNETRYVTVVIANPHSTRAAEFEYGTEKENEIRDVYFVFYDEDGKVVGNNSIVDIVLQILYSVFIVVAGVILNSFLEILEILFGDYCVESLVNVNLINALYCGFYRLFAAAAKNINKGYNCCDNDNC